MKTCVMVLLLGLCLVGIPGVSEAALDWQIRWSDLESPQSAKVYIFNPESTSRSFSLETGDIAETSNTGPHAPYIIIGQDVSLQIQPGERKIFDILVYQDVDPNNTYGAQNTTTSTLSAGAYQILLEGRPSSGTGNSRQDEYPISSRGISLVPRATPVEQEYNYRNERGYWKLILVDHDHVAEQLIRTGNRMGASHTSIQQAILFYTQGCMALSTQAESVFYGAFPELKTTTTTPPSCPLCAYCVTLVSSASLSSLRVGDVLQPENPTLSPVVFAEYLSDDVSAGTATSTDLLVTLAMKRQGVPPYVGSRYLSIVENNSQLKQVIQTGIIYGDSYCAIQDVVWYVNKEVSSLTEDGKKLWDRIEGNNSRPTTCFGGRSSSTLAELEAEPENWKNLAVLFGAIVPFGVMLKRKGRK